MTGVNLYGNNGGVPNRAITRETTCARCHLSNAHVCVHVDIESQEATYAMPDSIRFAALEACGAGEVEHEEQLREISEWAEAVSKRCKSCGALCMQFGCRHEDSCDIDLSITAQERWSLRNPQSSRRWTRKKLIRQRWAVLNGRCRECVARPTEVGLVTCRACLDRIYVSRGRMPPGDAAVAA